MNPDQRHIAFDLFYAEHAAPAYRFALRLSGNPDDAEDMTAQALAKAFRHWKHFRGDAEARTWLCKIVLNEWRMHCRKRPKQEFRLDAIEHVATTMQSDDLGLSEAIMTLPQPQREAFLLVKGEGLSHAQAAKAARVPVGTMYFRVHAAMVKLRAILAPEVNEREICPELKHELEV